MMNAKDLTSFMSKSTDRLMTSEQTAWVLSSVLTLGSKIDAGAAVAILAGLKRRTTAHSEREHAAYGFLVAIVASGAPSMDVDDAASAVVWLTGLGVAVPISLVSRVSELAHTMGEPQLAAVLNALPIVALDCTALARAYVSKCTKMTTTAQVLALVRLCDGGARFSRDDRLAIAAAARNFDPLKLQHATEGARCAARLAALLEDTGSDVVVCKLIRFIEDVMRSQGETRATVTDKVGLLGIATSVVGTAGVSFVREAGTLFASVTEDVRLMDHGEVLVALVACLALTVPLPSELLGAVLRTMEKTSPGELAFCVLALSKLGALDDNALASVNLRAGSLTCGEMTTVIQYMVGKDADADSILKTFEARLVSTVGDMDPGDLMAALLLFYGREGRVPEWLEARMSILTVKQLTTIVAIKGDLPVVCLLTKALDAGLFDNAAKSDVTNAIGALAKIGDAPPALVHRLYLAFVKAEVHMSLAQKIETYSALAWLGERLTAPAMTLGEMDGLSAASASRLLVAAAVLGEEPNASVVARLCDLAVAGQCPARFKARAVAALAVCYAHGHRFECPSVLAGITTEEAFALRASDVAPLLLAATVLPALGTMCTELSGVCRKATAERFEPVKSGLAKFGVTLDVNGQTGLFGQAGSGKVVVVHDNTASVSMYTALLRSIGLVHVPLVASEYKRRGISYLGETLGVLSDARE